MEKLIYMDQENPPVAVKDLLVEFDASAPYEVDRGAIFTTEHGFVGVVINGCS